MAERRRTCRRARRHQKVPYCVEEVCGICHNPITDCAHVTPNGHRFHQACVLSVCRLGQTQCPVCNQESLNCVEEACGICLEPILFTERTQLTPRGHYFHETCLHQWCATSRTCPTCREDLDVPHCPPPPPVVPQLLLQQSALDWHNIYENHVFMYGFIHRYLLHRRFPNADERARAFPNGFPSLEQIEILPNLREVLFQFVSQPGNNVTSYNGVPLIITPTFVKNLIFFKMIIQARSMIALAGFRLADFDFSIQVGSPREHEYEPTMDPWPPHLSRDTPPFNLLYP